MESEISEDITDVELADLDAVLDPNNPEHAYAILERDFNQTLADLEQDENATKYSDNFNRMFEAFYKAHSEKALLEERTKLAEAELQAKAQQLQLALDVTQADRSYIDDLKSQINNAWKLADAAHSREQIAQETIDNLRKQIENLNAEIDFRNKMAQESSEESLTDKNKEGLEREKERLMGEVNQLSQKLTNALGYQEELERKNSLADMKINDIALQLEEQTNEVEKGKNERERLEGEIEGLHQTIEDKENSIGELNGTIKDLKKDIATLEGQLKDSNQETEKITKDFDHLNVKYSKLQDEFDKIQYNLSQIKNNLSKKLVDLRQANDEVIHLKNDVQRLQKARDILEKRQIQLEKDKDEIAIDRNKLRQRFGIFEREIDDYKRLIDENKRTIEVLHKEKEILSKQITRQQLVTQEQQTLFKLQDQTKKKLEAELDAYFIESNKQKKVISNLERDRDRLSEEQLDLKKKIEDTLDDVKLKKAQIYELKKSLAEQKTAFRMQQNMFEAMRADKNALQKALQESSAESGELKKKLKISSHQTEQLKEDIAMKEQLLVKEENILRKVMKEKENLRIEVDNAMDTIKSLKQEIVELHEEERRLHKVILVNERLIRQQAKDLDQLMNERDILGAQLVRRNDEIALLHEKIMILETTLHRGESQYDQRLEDLRLLKIEIKRLRQEKNLMAKSLDNMVDLRQEVFHLERDLTRARLKCRALEEEVQNPLNIHRWRKLEGSDPEIVDLLQKTQILQKRLLRQTAEAVERERQLKEAEKLYLNLKQVLSKQPGPGIREALNKTQRALKLRGNKLKCLVSELNMTELQASEYKSELQKVSDEFVKLKQQFLDEKKANQALRRQLQSSRELSQVQVHHKDSHASGGSLNAPVKFTGGGFRMSVPSLQAD